MFNDLLKSHVDSILVQICFFFYYFTLQHDNTQPDFAHSRRDTFIVESYVVYDRKMFDMENVSNSGGKS